MSAFSSTSVAGRDRSFYCLALALATLEDSGSVVTLGAPLASVVAVFWIFVGGSFGSALSCYLNWLIKSKVLMS